MSRAFVLIFIASFCLCSSAGYSAGSDLHFSLGYSASVYQNVSNKDINAAVSVLVRKIVWKHFGKGESRFYDNLSEMASDLKNRKIQVICSPPEEFMELRTRIPIDPILVSTSDGGHESELLLIVRKDSGISSVRDLKNRIIVIPQNNSDRPNIFLVWLETLLMREGEHGSDSFFASVKETRTTARVVMPVFFKQADACVVSRQVFDLTKELNPQLGRDLIPIAHIAKLSQGIIAIDRRLPEEIRQKIRQAFLTVDETPEGRQLLMLFKVKKLIPFKPEYLKATEALFAEYRGRRARLARK